MSRYHTPSGLRASTSARPGSPIDTPGIEGAWHTRSVPSASSTKTCLRGADGDTQGQRLPLGDEPRTPGQNPHQAEHPCTMRDDRIMRKLARRSAERVPRACRRRARPAAGDLVTASDGSCVCGTIEPLRPRPRPSHRPGSCLWRGRLNPCRPTRGGPRLAARALTAAVTDVGHRRTEVPRRTRRRARRVSASDRRLDPGRRARHVAARTAAR
jgi:hypothetical protein